MIRRTSSQVVSAQEKKNLEFVEMGVELKTVLNQILGEYWHWLVVKRTVYYITRIECESYRKKDSVFWHTLLVSREPVFTLNRHLKLELYFLTSLRCTLYIQNTLGWGFLCFLLEHS